MYGGWTTRVVPADARKAVLDSADRYLAALDGAYVEKYPTYQGN